MSRAPSRIATTVMMAIAFAANTTAAAPRAEVGDAPAVPEATVLLRFYPARLPSTPIGVVEDQQVWLAKVQGLMVGAPPMLQQSLLMSQTRQEFAANVALLQQMQESALAQSGLRFQRQFQRGLVQK